MSTLKHVEGPVIHCYDFDDFVKEVYGKMYSTVNGMIEVQGHYTYEYIDVDQWSADADEWGIDTEHQPTFEEWMKLEGWDSHNNCPAPEAMVLQLIKDGHDVPRKFWMLVDW